MGLKREFQCNLLPAMCKNDTAIAEKLSGACASKMFARELRDNGGNGVGTIFGSVLTVLLGLLASTLLY